MREILLSSTAFPYLDEQAAAVLEEKREAIQPLFQSGRAGIEVKDGELRWWTFAGGKINATLRYGLEAVGGDWKITTDNFLVKAKGEGITHERFQDATQQLAKPEIWDDEKLWGDVAESLPNYRLSKFQDLMPDWVEHEVVAGYLLSTKRARDWCYTHPRTH
jgi:ATP-dependent Lhr-like helicase